MIIMKYKFKVIHVLNYKHIIVDFAFKTTFFLELKTINDSFNDAYL